MSNKREISGVISLLLVLIALFLLLCGLIVLRLSVSFGTNFGGSLLVSAICLAPGVVILICVHRAGLRGTDAESSRPAPLAGTTESERQERLL